jgi:hypothetical protein
MEHIAASDYCLFSIIIPLLNEADQINSVIDHLKGRSSERGFEVIVVDADPSGSSIKWIKEPDVISITAESGQGNIMNASGMSVIQPFLSHYDLVRRHLSTVPLKNSPI